jgi:hypothetical protein
MPLPTLTALGAGHGFTSGDLDTSKNTVAMCPAYQKIYFADGRPYDADIHLSGYHKLDFINTRLVGDMVSGVFTKGETVIQKDGETIIARGVYDESVDREDEDETWHLVYRTTTAQFDKTHTITGADSGATLVPSDVVVPPHWLNWTLEEVQQISYSYGGTAVSGGNTTLVDTSLIPVYTVDNAFNGQYIYITGGVGKGSWAVITGYTASSGTIHVADWLTVGGSGGGTNPSAGSTYGVAVTAMVKNTGVFPDGGSIIMALCFGRIFMNSVYNPHQWYATRVNNPLDLLVSQDDVGTLISSQTSRAGLVGSPLTAMIAYKDNYFVIGCIEEVWVLRSDPAAGGVLTRVSQETGIFSNTAWCFDQSDNLYFVGTDGIYGLSADSIINAQAPIHLTKERLPRLITRLNLNHRTDRVNMAWDADRHGIMVCVSQMDGAWSFSFWVDLRTGGIFPETYQQDHIAASMFYFESRKSEERNLLLGSYDGYIRKFSDTDKSDDDSNAIQSYVTIGPIVGGGKKRLRTACSDISIITGLGTDGVEVGLYTADTGQQLVQNVLDNVDPVIKRIFTGNKMLPSIRQRFSAGAIALKIGNSQTEESWNMERIVVDLEGSK